jgi:hypothetical protein
MMMYDQMGGTMMFAMAVFCLLGLLVLGLLIVAFVKYLRS